MSDKMSIEICINGSIMVFDAVIRRKSDAVIRRKSKDIWIKSKGNGAARYQSMLESGTANKVPVKKAKKSKPDTMSMSKHGKCGHATKSPKFRHAMKREAENAEAKRKTLPLTHQTVKELFK